MIAHPSKDQMEHQKGVTLIELIISIVVISVAVTAVSAVYMLSVKRSADPLIQRQALSIAEAYLDEVLSKHYSASSSNCPASANSHRSLFCSVDDYDGLSEAPTNQRGVPIHTLSDFTVSINVINTLLEDTPAKRVDVAVTHPSGINLRLSGHRTEY